MASEVIMSEVKLLNSLSVYSPNCPMYTLCYQWRESVWTSAYSIFGHHQSFIINKMFDKMVMPHRWINLFPVWILKVLWRPKHSVSGNCKPDIMISVSIVCFLHWSQVKRPISKWIRFLTLRRSLNKIKNNNNNNNSVHVLESHVFNLFNHDG